jgi:hypothetical protein
MKKAYITPQTNIHHLVSSRILAGSGPGATEQPNPGISQGSGSSRFLDDWDDDDMNDEDM